MNPDYSNYTLDELLDALRNIDEEMYPNRANEIRQFILSKKKLKEGTITKKNENPVWPSFLISKLTIAKPLSILVILIVVYFILKLIFMDNPYLYFRDISLNSKIDSVIVDDKDLPRTRSFFTNNKRYILPSGYYNNFCLYINKGDSLSKKEGRWDIYVFKRKNGQIIKKYFKGAQDDWE